MMNFVGPAVLCDLEVLAAELALAATCGSRVCIDRQAPVVLPIHKQLDRGREAIAGSNKIGTTGRGIGPCSEDFIARRGVRIRDLVDRDHISKALRARGYYAEKVALARYLGEEPMNESDLVEWLWEFGRPVYEFQADTVTAVRWLCLGPKQVVFECAQGVMLDIYNGTYPYVTTSLCTPAVVGATYGMDVLADALVVGVTKAYVTRVGGGPFPTELDGEEGDRIRSAGKEFGTTTGRPRRCGWLDLTALRWAVQVARIQELVVTKVDVFGGFSTIKVAQSYQLDGVTIASDLRLTTEVMEQASPQYVDVPGWSAQELVGVECLADLPPALDEYLRRIEHATGVRVVGLGLGPDRSQYVKLTP
jgi:adenylosuccinate synthase